MADEIEVAAIVQREALNFHAKLLSNVPSQISHKTLMIRRFMKLSSDAGLSGIDRGGQLHFHGPEGMSMKSGVEESAWKTCSILMAVVRLSKHSRCRPTRTWRQGKGLAGPTGTAPGGMPSVAWRLS